MAPLSGFVETPDVRLHYVDWGGDGPPLLLIHATGFHARLWDPYAERLRDRFHVIAYDQRGHGDSGPARDGNYAWDTLAQDCHAVIETLGIEGCMAAGHSSGGTAAGMCAGQYPGSIGRVVLLDPVVGRAEAEAGPWPGENPMAERTRRRRAIWESPHQFEEAMRTRPAFARWQPEFLSLYARFGLRRRPDGHYELKCSPEVEAAIYEGVGRFNPWPALERIAAPALVLRATLSDTSSPRAAARIPRAREMLVPTTHFVPMEAPETVLEAMERFLAID